MSVNSAPKFPMLAYNFYLGLNCTSHKAFEFVSGNLDGPALRTIQRIESLNDSKSKPFIDHSKQMVKEWIIWFIKEIIDGVQGPNSFSAGFDAKKLVKGVHFSEHNHDIVGGAYPDHFFPVSESSVGGVENKLTDLKLEKNGAELAFEIKIIVLTLQLFREGMLTYIIICGRPQTNNKSNNFIKVVKDACTNSCESMEDMRFFNIAVDGVPCEYVMIQESLLN